MDGKQNINCTVCSCKFNDNEKQCCELKQIIVAPMPNCDTRTADESMCSSYKCSH